MKELACQFCHNKTQYVPIVKKSIKHIRAIDVFYCFACNAEFSFLLQKDVSTVNLYCIINNYLYKWTRFEEKSSAYLYFIGSPGIPGARPNKDVKLIKRFEKENCPDINPFNIKEKLSTYLLFL